MVMGLLEDSGSYSGLHPLFGEAFRFLHSCGAGGPVDGRREIAGERLYAVSSRDQGRTRGRARLEVHRRHIDIHCVFEGVDAMGWRPLADCAQPSGPFDVEKDVRFFLDTPETWIDVRPGMFVVFFPHDAHAPMAGEGLVRKIVLKVAL